MAQRLNTEIYQIEQDLASLISDMNQPIGDKDATQLSENILNNYFDALQWLESETLRTMNKLAKVENLMSSKLYEWYNLSFPPSLVLCLINIPQKLWNEITRSLLINYLGISKWLSLKL